MKYLEFLGSTTDTLLVLLTCALILFTFKGILDPKDFYAFCGMVASYKFGRSMTNATTPTVTSQDSQAV